MENEELTPGLFRILTRDAAGNITAYTKALDPFEIAALMVCIAKKQAPDARFNTLGIMGTPILLERTKHTS